MRLVGFISKAGSVLALLTMIASTIALTSYSRVLERIEKVDAHIDKLPNQLGEWVGTELPGLGFRSRDILKLDRHLRRVYRDKLGRQVLVYVGYWLVQSGEHQAAKHSPKICLPSNGWRIEQTQSKTLSLETKHGSENLKLNTILGAISSEESLFYYWFFSGEKTYWEEWRALVNISLESFLHGRSDGGIVELSVSLPVETEKSAAIRDAQATIEEFVRVFYPELRDLILQAQPERS